jgi:signal transduction histidine kinase
MQQRAAALDGTLTIEKTMPGTGTRVTLEIPLKT